MHRLHGGYAQCASTGATDLTGHLFEGRYGASAALTDEQLLVTAAYIARNPVEAGLCR